MVFNSILFCAFFALFFFLYRLAGLRKGASCQNMLLLAGSLFFYGCWDWRFVGLLMLTIISSYTTAIVASRSPHAKAWTALNIILNIGILFFFKYFNFFSDTFARLFETLGISVGWLTLDVILPVGISFYTFQAIGYSVDTYRRVIRPERDFVTFAVFISYFPQLVAGPIERASYLMPQLRKRREWDYPRIVKGMRQALWGLLKKVVIADACANFVDKYFAMAHPSEASVPIVLLSSVVFTVQIYCDFSGYCDIARGVSNCLGIDLTQNFRLPLFSPNVRDFWRRWNVSLMAWFREYVYIPLGGSHRGLRRTLINIMAVFVLSGLWHGASWNFVLWGVYWGLIMVIYRLIKHYASGRLPDVSQYAGIIITDMLAVVGFMIFRSASVSQIIYGLPKLMLGLLPVCLCAFAAVTIWQKMSHRWRRGLICAGAIAFAAALIRFTAPVIHAYLFIYIAIMVIVEWRTRSLDCPMFRMPRAGWKRVAIYWLSIFILLVSYMEDIPFIYFQF